MEQSIREQLEHPEGSDGEPDRETSADKPGIVLTFETLSHQRAFAAWIASGDCERLLWAWMGRNGYHV